MKTTLNRRLFLRGAGTVLIGLPLVEELVAGRVLAQNNELPTRVLTMSFGLGIERPLQAEGMQGPLAPLLKFAPKASFFSNLANSSLASGGGPHGDVGGTQFTGIKQPPGEAEAGGASLEQLFKKHLHSGNVPTIGGVGSKSAGIWSRTGNPTQFMRHWNENGSPGEVPIRRPSVVFKDLFGSVKPQDPPGTPPDPNAILQRKINMSVLDAVKVEYETLMGPRSFLGAESKGRMDAHLTTLREVEMRLIGADPVDSMMQAQECKLPKQADFADPEGVTFYDAPTGATTGPTVPWQDAEKAFRLNGELFALGMSCDALRYGSMIFVGAGEHLRFQGNYQSPVGNLDFSDAFKNASPHDAIFHRYVVDAVRVYQYYVISQIAHVLEKMDSITERNGKTVLDNTVVVIGTEYGKNHNGDQGIFHAVVGGNGKFKPGQYDDNLSVADVYATVLKAYGVPSKVQGKEISTLLA